MGALASHAVASRLCRTGCWGRPPSVSLVILSCLWGLTGHSQRQPAVWRARVRCGFSAAVVGSSWRGTGLSFGGLRRRWAHAPVFVGEDGELRSLLWILRHGPLGPELFTVAKIRRPPECPSTDDRIKKTGCMYTTKCDSAKKKKEEEEILPFATTRMDLKEIVLSGMSQSEKSKRHVISRLCGIFEKQANKRETDAQIQRRKCGSPGWRGAG